MPRLVPLVAAIALVAAACSGDDDGPGVAGSTVDSTTSAGSTDDTSGDSSGGTSGATTTTVAATTTTEVDPLAGPWSVAVDIRLADGPVDETLDVEFDPASAEGLDPFGRFASCSGLRDAFSVYSMSVGVAEGSILDVSVLSDEAVPGPGTSGASIRVGLADGSWVVATGTITVDDGLRSGSFVGFDPAGSEVSGEFECVGSDEVEPSPLTPGAIEGESVSAEVVALITSGDDEQVLVLAARSDGPAVPDVLECPALDGGGDSLIRVVGDQFLGSITSFDLTGDVPSLALTVGAESYVFDTVTVDLADDMAAGAFSGENVDGVAIDGAYRCE